MLEPKPEDLTIEISLTATISRRQLELLTRPIVPAAVPSPDISTIEQQLMTVQQAAEYLGVAKSALYSLRYTGDGPPAYKIGSRLRFRRDKIDEWLELQLSEDSRS